MLTALEIQSEIDAAMAAGRGVTLPAERIMLDRALQIVGGVAGFHLRGHGVATMLYAGPNGPPELIRQDSWQNDSQAGIEIGDMTLVGNGQPGQIGLHITGTGMHTHISLCHYHNLNFLNLDTGVLVSKQSTTVEIGFDWNRFESVSMSAVRDGVRFLHGSGTGNQLRALTMLCNGTAIAYGGLSNIGDVIIQGCQFANIGDWCVFLANTAQYRNNILIGQCQFDGGQGGAVSIDNYTSVKLVDILWGGATYNNLTNIGANSQLDLPTGMRVTQLRKKAMKLREAVIR